MLPRNCLISTVVLRLEIEEDHGDTDQDVLGIALISTVGLRHTIHTMSWKSGLRLGISLISMMGLRRIGRFR